MSGKRSWKNQPLTCSGGRGHQREPESSVPSLPHALHLCQGTVEGDATQTSHPFSPSSSPGLPLLSISNSPKNEEG